MRLSRRQLLKSAAALPMAKVSFASNAASQTLAAPAGGEIPPILLLHGNGDHAALWITTLWRLESNGIARERLAAPNFTDPLARTDDKVAQPARSSTEDQLRELTEAIAALKHRTGAPRVALVASSRGGNAARNYIRNGGGANVSHAVLCGTPNHGVYAWDDGLGSEFNGKGPFLRGLNENADGSEVTPGTAFLTLRSDGIDKFAQPDGRFVGKAGTPTGVTAEGPELRGAINLVIGALDHREVAFHPRAFREIYKFIAGHEPRRIAISPQAEVKLAGLVTGNPVGGQTNRPVADATVEIFAVHSESGERIGDPILRARTASDGRWGPASVDPSWPLEFVITVAGAPVTHLYRSPFPRSSDVVHLRPARPPAAAETGAGAIVTLSRPRGYFGLPRDVVLLDGKQPTDVKSGVPTDSTTTVRLPATEAGRAVIGIFNEERIVARAWPLSENRVTIAELTY